MRKKNHDRKKWGSRLFKSLLLVMLVFSFCTRGVAVQPLIAEASAAVQKKNKIIPLGGTSGRYLVDTGYNWWLKDKNGGRVSGFQYIVVPGGNRLKTGYYMFDKSGRLSKNKQFYN